MALRLRGATSGYIELKAPAAAGDNTLTLPANNGGDNQLLKIDGSGNLSWQSNLTFDGTSLKIGNNFAAHTEGDDLVIGGSGWRGMTIYGEGGGGVIQFADDAGNRDGQIMYDHGNRMMMIRTAGNVNRLVVTSDGAALLGNISTNPDGRNLAGLVTKSPGGISFQNYGGSHGSRNWRIRPDDMTSWGALEFSVSPTANDSTDWPDAATDAVLVLEGSKDVVVKNGNLKIGSVGKGINFSAYADGTGNPSSNLLDDYEEGTWSPTIIQGITAQSYSIQSGYYIKIGHKVHLDFYMRVDTANANAVHYRVGSFPFPIRGAGHIRGGGCSTFWNLNVDSSYGTHAQVVSFYGVADSTAAELYQGDIACRGVNASSNDDLYLIGFYEYITDD